jgi:hypothetical protein
VWSIGFGARPARAVPGYLSSFEAAYPDATGSRIDACGLCHTNVPKRNAYGTAYAGAGHLFAPIESADSDGDGFTNLEEIVALTFPGDASDTPAVQPSPTPTATPPPTATATPVVGGCSADCNGDGTVQIDELVRAVNIALGSTALDVCTAADRNGNGSVTIDELLAAVNAALSGCPAA